jgi:hypothetical protein
MTVFLVAGECLADRLEKLEFGSILCKAAWSTDSQFRFVIFSEKSYRPVEC